MVRTIWIATSSDACKYSIHGSLKKYAIVRCHKKLLHLTCAPLMFARWCDAKLMHCRLQKVQSSVIFLLAVTIATRTQLSCSRRRRLASVNVTLSGAFSRRKSNWCDFFDVPDQSNDRHFCIQNRSESNQWMQHFMHMLERRNRPTFRLISF